MANNGIYYNSGNTLNFTTNNTTWVTLSSGGTLTVTGLTNTSGLTSTGGVTFPQKTVNSTYIITDSDYMVDITGGTFNVQLTSAVGVRGRLLAIKNNGGGAVTILPYGGEQIDDKSLLILSETNAVQLVSNGTQWVILGQDRSTVNNSTGVFQFSGLSKVSNTEFSVARVRGWIVDTTTNPLSPQIFYVDYSGGTHTDLYVNTAFETFVYLTSGGTIGQSNAPLTEQERRQNIFLGKIGHPEKTSINLVFSQPDFVLSPLSQLRDVFTPINLINGGVYPSVNGANLTFNTSAGYIYGLGINFVSDSLSPNNVYVSGQTPCTFQYRTQTGGTVTNVTNIDPTKWDVGGVVTNISGTKSTNQRIYLLQNGQFRIQYGQTEYNQLSAAIAGIQTETFTVFPNFRNNAVLIGILSVTSSCTDLSDTTKAQFLLVSKFGETVGAAGGISTTTLQQAYNNSSDPEITINSTLDGLSIKNGTGNADNVTSLLQGQNTAGTTTSFIRADGLFSGQTVSTPSFTANTNGLTSTTVSATTITASTLTVTGPTTLSGVTTFNSGLVFNGLTNSPQVSAIVLDGSGNAYLNSNLINTVNTSTGLSGSTSAGVVTLVNTLPDQTVTITGGTNMQIVGTYPNFGVNFTGTTGGGTFTGGTVTGSTNFTNGLTANTISATTYQNLPFSGTVRGTGTVNYIPKWTGSTGISNSTAFDDGSFFTIPNTYISNSLKFIPNEYYDKIDPYYNLVRFDGSELVKPLSNEGFGGDVDLISGSVFLTLSNDSDSRAIEIFYTLRSTDDGNFRSGKIIANWNSSYSNFYQTEYGPNYDLTTMTFIDPPQVFYGGSGTVIRVSIDFDDVTDPGNLLTARFKYVLL